MEEAGFELMEARRSSFWRRFWPGAAALLALALAGCSATGEPRAPAPEGGPTPAGKTFTPLRPPPPERVKVAPGSQQALREVEERYGIELAALRLTGGGRLLDFRYRIKDPEKAKPILDRTVKPVLIDQATGAKGMVPRPAKLGPIRSIGKAEAGRVYFMLFTNPYGVVVAGKRVTVEIGEFRAKDLVVE